MLQLFLCFEKKTSTSRPSIFVSLRVESVIKLNREFFVTRLTYYRYVDRPEPLAICDASSTKGIFYMHVLSGVQLAKSKVALINFRRQGVSNQQKATIRDDESTTTTATTTVHVCSIGVIEYTSVYTEATV